MFTAERSFNVLSRNKCIHTTQLKHLRITHKYSPVGLVGGTPTRTHARTHARTQACTHARTHATTLTLYTHATTHTPYKQSRTHTHPSSQTHTPSDMIHTCTDTCHSGGNSLLTHTINLRTAWSPPMNIAGASLRVMAQSRFSLFNTAVESLHRGGDASLGHDNATIKLLDACIESAPTSAHACVAHLLQAALYDRMQEYDGVRSATRTALLTKAFYAKAGAIYCIGLDPLEPNLDMDTKPAAKRLLRATNMALHSESQARAAVSFLEPHFPCLFLGIQGETEEGWNDGGRSSSCTSSSSLTSFSPSASSSSSCPSVSSPDSQNFGGGSVASANEVCQTLVRPVPHTRPSKQSMLDTLDLLILLQQASDRPRSNKGKTKRSRLGNEAAEQQEVCCLCDLQRFQGPTCVVLPVWPFLCFLRSRRLCRPDPAKKRHVLERNVNTARPPARGGQVTCRQRRHSLRGPELGTTDQPTDRGLFKWR